MRVLIIGHNAIGETNNMGKTLLSYFRGFSPDEVAEFYIQAKEPKNAEVSNSYYRVTDQDALKSVFGKKSEQPSASNNPGRKQILRLPVLLSQSASMEEKETHLFIQRAMRYGDLPIGKRMS